jgi:hypothetical protein
VLKPQLTEQARALQVAQESEKNLRLQLDAQKKAQEAEIEKAVTTQLSEQRAVLAQQSEKDLAKKDSEYKREMDKLRAQLKDMTKRLEKKTANELGETPEIDLFEALRDSFSEDQIIRIKKGQPGADIRQTVLDHSQECGRIVFDSKNHMAWRNDFVSKLRQDQLEAGADHAILSTTVFPSGQKELCIVDGVVVVNPARAIYVVQILRAAVVSLHRQGMSLQQRRTKMEELYSLITSVEYSGKLTEAIRVTEAILELDVEEKKQHDKIWKERGRLAKGLQKAIQKIDDDVYAITGNVCTDGVDVAESAHHEEVSF